MNRINRLRMWAKKYKLLHVFFWTLLVILNLVVYFDEDLPVWATILENLMLVAVGIVPFYFTAYFLVPNYLYQQKYGTFFLIAVFSATGMTITYLIYYFTSIYIFYPQEYKELIKENTFYKITQEFFIIFWTYMIPLLCASTIKVMSDRFRSETKLKAIRQEKLNTELNFLRSQINPHFLFNVMNTIYFQISKENKNARSLVEVISDMLRYQLYECNAPVVTIEKEVEYINNFIYINRFRNNFSGDVSMEIAEGIDNSTIAPLLIQPMVENAMHYLEHVNSDFPLRIKINKNQEGKIQIHIFNHFEIQPNDAETYVTGDPSLDNFRRRLEIIYPQTHQFVYFNDKNQYYSKLTLTHG